MNFTQSSLGLGRLAPPMVMSVSSSSLGVVGRALAVGQRRVVRARTPHRAASGRQPALGVEQVAELRQVDFAAGGETAAAAAPRRAALAAGRAAGATGATGPPVEPLAVVVVTPPPAAAATAEPPPPSS